MAGRRNRFARRYRACGYSQESLAAELNVDRTTVGRWVRGESEPHGAIRPKLARLLHMTLSELQLLLEPGGGPQTTPPRSMVDIEMKGGDLDDVIRRNFLQLVTMAGAAVSLQPAAEAAAHGGEFDGMGPHLWKVYSRASSKRSVLPVVRDQVAELASALRGARGTAHKRLCAEASDLFQLVGEIMFDGNRYTDAAQCYTLAANAARESGNADLWACALTRHSFIGLYGDRRYEETEPLLSLARDVALRGDPQLSTRHWVAAVQAEVYAAIGDFSACQRALDAADEVHGLSGPVRNSGWLRFDGSRLHEERGTCYLKLGRADLAEASLTTALGMSTSHRRKGAVLADLALLGAQRRDVDQLLEYASGALDIARQSQSGYVGRRLQDLRPQLKALRSDRRVKELEREISSLSAI